jgi:hypothetical protein
MAGQRSGAGLQVDAAGHAEVAEQFHRNLTLAIGLAECKDQVFAATLDGLERTTNQNASHLRSVCGRITFGRLT